MSVRVVCGCVVCVVHECGVVWCVLVCSVLVCGMLVCGVCGTCGARVWSECVVRVRGVVWDIEIFCKCTKNLATQNPRMVCFSC